MRFVYRGGEGRRKGLSPSPLRGLAFPSSTLYIPPSPPLFLFLVVLPSAHTWLRRVHMHASSPSNNPSSLSDSDLPKSLFDRKRDFRQVKNIISSAISIKIICVPYNEAFRLLRIPPVFEHVSVVVLAAASSCQPASQPASAAAATVPSRACKDPSSTRGDLEGGTPQPSSLPRSVPGRRKAY